MVGGIELVGGNRFFAPFDGLAKLPLVCVSTSRLMISPAFLVAACRGVVAGHTLFRSRRTRVRRKRFFLRGFPAREFCPRQPMWIHGMHFGRPGSIW